MNPLAIKPLFAFASLAETAEAIAALGGSRPEGARIGVLRQGGRWCVYLWGVSAGTVALDKRNPAALAGLLECGSFTEAAEYAAAHEAGNPMILQLAGGAWLVSGNPLAYRRSQTPARQPAAASNRHKHRKR